MQVVAHEFLGALLQLARQVARGRRRRLGPHAAGQHLAVARAKKVCEAARAVQRACISEEYRWKQGASAVQDA